MFPLAKLADGLTWDFPVPVDPTTTTSGFEGHMVTIERRKIPKSIRRLRINHLGM